MQTVPPNYLLLFYYQFAYIHFPDEKFAKSLYWVNQLINTNFGVIREDLQCYTRLLNLDVHLELKHIIVLRYAVDSTRRFIKKKRMMTTFTQEALNLFSKLSLAYPEEYHVIFKNAYSKLFSRTDKTTEDAIGYIDLKDWLIQKINAGNNKC